MMKIPSLCMALLLSGCASVTSQSIYEGLRTQQHLKDAGALPAPDKMESYDRYEKQRERLQLPGEAMQPQ